MFKQNVCLLSFPFFAFAHPLILFRSFEGHSQAPWLAKSVVATLAAESNTGCSRMSCGRVAVPKAGFCSLRCGHQCSRLWSGLGLHSVSTRCWTAPTHMHAFLPVVTLLGPPPLLFCSRACSCSSSHDLLMSQVALFYICCLGWCAKDLPILPAAKRN